MPNIQNSQCPIFKLPRELIAAIIEPPLNSNGTDSWDDREYAKYREVLMGTCTSFRSLAISLTRCWISIPVSPRTFSSGRAEMLETYLHRSGTSDFRLTLDRWDDDVERLDELERCLLLHMHRCTGVFLVAHSSAAVDLFTSRFNFPNLRIVRLELGSSVKAAGAHPNFAPDSPFLSATPLTSLSVSTLSFSPERPVFSGLFTINTSQLHRLSLTAAIPWLPVVELLKSCGALEHLIWGDSSRLSPIDDGWADTALFRSWTLPNLRTLRVHGDIPQQGMRCFDFPRLEALQIHYSYFKSGSTMRLLQGAQLPSLRTFAFPLDSEDDSKEFLIAHPNLEALYLKKHPSLDRRCALGVLGRRLIELATQLWNHKSEQGPPCRLRDFYLSIPNKRIATRKVRTGDFVVGLLALLHTIPDSRVHFVVSESRSTLTQEAPAMKEVMDGLGVFNNGPSGERILWTVLDDKDDIWQRPWSPWEYRN